MINFSIGLLLLAAPQTTAPPTQVLAVLTERTSKDVSLRFVLSGGVDSYSATREGDEIVVRIGASAAIGLGVPAPAPPIGALALGSEPAFSLRVSIAASWEHEILRESASLRLVLRQPATPSIASGAAAVPGPAPAVPAKAGETAPQVSPSPERAVESKGGDTADLYRRLFPSLTDPNAGGMPRTELTLNVRFCALIRTVYVPAVGVSAFTIT